MPKIPSINSVKGPKTGGTSLAKTIKNTAANQVKNIVSRTLSTIDTKLTKSLIVGTGLQLAKQDASSNMVDALLKQSKRVADIVNKDPRFILQQAILHALNIRYGKAYNPASAYGALLPLAGGNLPSTLDVLAGNKEALVEQIDRAGLPSLATRSKINVAQDYQGYSPKTQGQNQGAIIQEFGPSKESLSERMARNRYTKKHMHYTHGLGVSKRDERLNVTFEDENLSTGGRTANLRINEPNYNSINGRYGGSMKTDKVWHSSVGQYFKQLVDSIITKNIFSTTDRNKINILVNYWNFSEITQDDTGKRGLKNVANYGKNKAGTDRLGLANVYIPSSDKKFEFESWQRDEIRELKAKLDRELRNGIRTTSQGEILLTTFNPIDPERDPNNQYQYFPFLFESITRKALGTQDDELPEKIFLQATIEGLTESYAPNWSSENYFGRTEPLYIYSNTNRSISFSFMIFANTPQELDLVRFKVNWLAQQNYGKFLKNNVLSYVPLLKLTVGELFQELGGIISSLDFDWNYNWEIYTNYRIPLMVKVSMNYTVIHDTQMDLDSVFYKKLGA